MEKNEINSPQTVLAADPFVKIDFIHDRTGPQTNGIKDGMRTDELRPTVMGSCTPNEIVMLYDGDKLLGSVQASSNGQWVFDFPFGQSLTPGEHQLFATIPGASSNTTGFTVDPTAKYNLLLDFVYAQAKPNVVLGESSNIPEIGVRGRTKPGELVEIYDGEKLVGRGYANSAGEYHIAINAPLSVGEHALRAKSASGESAEKPFTLTPPPPADYLEITGVRDENGRPLVEGEANASRYPTFFGKTVPFASVDVWDGAQLLGTAVANIYGEWHFNVPHPLYGGEHAIVAKTAEGSATFTLITHAPSAPAAPMIEHVFDDVGAEIGELAAGAETDDSRPRLQGTAEPYRYVTVFDNGRPIGQVMTDNKGQWQFTPGQPLAAGAHSLTVGYPGGAQSQAFDVTVTEPQIARPVITSLYDDVGKEQGIIGAGESTDDSRPRLQGTAEPYRYVTVFDNGRPIGQVMTDNKGHWQFTPGQPLAAGAHSLTVGYPGGAQSEAFDVTVTEPQIARPVITSLYDDVGKEQGIIGAGESTDDSRPRLQGTAEPYRYVTVFDNGRPIGQVMTDNKGHWQFTPGQPLAAGAHSLTVGYPGGAQSEAFDVTVTEPQIARPVITSLYDDVGKEQGIIGAGESTDDSRPRLQGTAEPYRYVTVFDNGRPIGQVMTDNKGQWQFTPGQPLAAGAHSLTVGYPGGAQSEAFDVTVTEPQIARPVITSLYDDVGKEQGIIGAGESTDDRCPQLTGTAAAGSWVNVVDNGTVIGYVQADSNGRWTFTVTSPLTLGEHRFTLVSDSVESAPYTVTVTSLVKDEWEIVGAYDNVGAETGLVANGGTTDDRYPEFTGRAPANSFVRVYAEHGLVAYTWADENGEWRVKSGVALPRGEINFVIEANNQQSDVFTLNVEGETLAPTLDNVYHGDLDGSITLVGEGMTTSPGYFYLDGKGEPDSVINIFEGSILVASVQVDSFGSWQLYKDVLQLLQNGNHTLGIEYADGRQRVEFDVNIDGSLSPFSVLQQPEELLLIDAVQQDEDAPLPLQINDGDLRMQPESVRGPMATPGVPSTLEDEALNQHAVSSY